MLTVLGFGLKFKIVFKLTANKRKGKERKSKQRNFSDTCFNIFLSIIFSIDLSILISSFCHLSYVLNLLIYLMFFISVRATEHFSMFLLFCFSFHQLEHKKNNVFKLLVYLFYVLHINEDLMFIRSFSDFF